MFDHVIYKEKPPRRWPWYIDDFGNLVQLRSRLSRVGIHIAYMAPVVGLRAIGVCGMVRGHISPILAGVAAHRVAARRTGAMATAGVAAAM